MTLTTKINMVDLQGQYQKIKTEVDAEIQEVLDAAWFIKGPKVAAFEQDLAMIPVINKVDMAAADPERVTDQIINMFDFKKEDIIILNKEIDFAKDYLELYQTRFEESFGRVLFDVDLGYYEMLLERFLKKSQELHKEETKYRLADM